MDLPEISSTSTNEASSFSVSVVLSVAGVITRLLWPEEEEEEEVEVEVEEEEVEVAGGWGVLMARLIIRCWW